jgi:hypothetical protein
MYFIWRVEHLVQLHLPQMSSEDAMHQIQEVFSICLLVHRLQILALHLDKMLLPKEVISIVTLVPCHSQALFSWIH